MTKARDFLYGRPMGCRVEYIAGAASHQAEAVVRHGRREALLFVLVLCRRVEDQQVSRGVASVMGLKATTPSMAY